MPIMVNWQKLILEIQGSGMTQQDIAKALDTSQGYVSDLINGRRGKRMSYEMAGKLISLHNDLSAGTPVSPANSSDSP